MAANEELISEYIDLSAVGAQTDAFLGQIKRLNEAYDQLASKSLNLGGLSTSKEITEQIKVLQTELAKLQKAKEDILKTDLASQKVATEEAKTRREVAKAVQEETKAKQDLAKQGNNENAAKAAIDKKSEAIARKYNADQMKAEQKAASDLAKAEKDAAKEAADAANKYKNLIAAYREAELRAKNLRLALDNVGKAGFNPGANAQVIQAEKAAAALKLQIDQLRASSSPLERYRAELEKSTLANARAEKSAAGFASAIGKAYGFVRIAANILPGLGISGIFLLAFEAIKAATQALGFFNDTIDKSAKKTADQKKEVEELIKTFRTFDEISAAAEGGTSATAIEVRTLAGVVQDQTKSYDERNNALLRLKDINKNYFGDLKLEGDSIKALTGLVDEYIAALINQAVVKELEGDIGKVSVAYNRQSKVVGELRKQLEELQPREKGLQLQNQISTKQYGEKAEKIRALNIKLREQYDLMQPLNKQFQDLKDEIEEATKAGLKFKPLKVEDGGNKTQVKLKTFDSKEEDELAKHFIELQKEVSQSVEVELSARIGMRKQAYNEEYNLLVGANEREKKVAQDKLNDVLNSKAGANERINAQREYDSTLITLKNKFTADSTLLELKFQEDLNKIQTSGRAKRLADEKRDNDLFEAEEKARHDARIKLQQKNADDRSTITSASRDNELDFLNKQYGQGLISTEKYQKEKYALEKKYEIRTLQDTLDNAEFLIANAKEYGTDVLKQDRIIADARKKLSDQLTNELLANETKLRDERKKITTQVIAGIGELVDNGYDREKNAIQDQIDVLNKKKATEVEAVNNSIGTAEDKAAQIAIINNRADDQQKALEKRQKDSDVKKAQFDKIIAEIQIGGQTAQAVQALSVKAAEARAEGALLAANPVTAAYASIAYASAGAIAAQIPIVIAQGIIAAGLVAARPIPRYKGGTMDHIGGPFIGGDGGKKELVVFPTGESFVTAATDTLYDAPAGTRVFPDVNDLPNEIMRMSMKPPRQTPAAMDNSMLIANTMNRGFNRLTNAVINKQETHFGWSNGELQKSHKNGEAWTHYKNRMV